MRKPIVFLIACAFPVFSQTTTKGITGIFTIPVGDFARKDGGGAAIGGAQPGFGLGVHGIYRVSSWIGAGVEGFLLYNPQDHRAAEEAFESGGVPSATASGGNYFNFPVLGAFSLYFPASDQMEVSLYGGVGMDFLKITEMQVTLGGSPVTLNFETDPAFAFSFGGKIKVNRYFAGFGFMDLGKHTVKSTIQGPAGTDSTSNDHIFRIVSVQAGVDF